MTQIFAKILQQIFRKQFFRMLRQRFGKARRGPQSKLIFLCGGVSERVEKTAQKSNFDFMVKSDF